MKKVRFIHCADLHLDTPFSSIGHEKGRSSTRRSDIRLVFRKIINTAKYEGADLLVICGDLYEHEFVKNSTINFVNDGFGEIPETDVLIIPGNHDPFTPYSFYRNFGWHKNVHILNRQDPYIFLEEKGVHVYGMGFGDPKDEIARVHSLKKAYDEHKTYNNEYINTDEYINILLVHGNVTMHFNENSYFPVAEEELDSLGMDYIALGHFHTRIEGLGKRRNIYNPGSPEPLGFDELGEHGFFKGEIIKESGGQSILSVEFVNSAAKFYRDIALDVSGCSSDEQVIDRIRVILAGEDARNGLYRISLKGYVKEGFSVNCARIKWQLEDSAFFIKIEDETQVEYDFSGIAREYGLKGLFARKMLDMINSERDEERKKLLVKAMHYGMEALEKGCVDIAL